MMRFDTLAACSVVIAAAAAAIPNASADAVSDFYRGKSINIYIGFGPGGGFDIYARMLARHFSKFNLGLYRG